MSTWILLMVILLCGLVLRVGVVPHTHYVYYDEFAHINIAQNILYLDSSCVCDNGTNQNCNSCHLMPWAPGYHTFLSAVFDAFGDSEHVAFNANAVIGSLSIIVFFLLAFLMTGKSTLALIGALMFNFIPVHLKYSGSSSLGIFSLFFIIISMIFLEIFLKKRDYRIFILFLTTLLFTIHIRPENILLLVVFAIYAFSRLKSDHIKKIIKSKYLVAISIFIIMLIPLAFQIYYVSFVGSTLGWNDSLFTKMEHFKNNIFQNIHFFIDPDFSSIIFLPLFIIGGIRLYLKNTKQLYYLLFIILLFLGIYSSYFIGNFILFEDAARFSLILYIPLLIISLNGIDIAFKKIPINRKIISVLFIFGFLISLISTVDFIYMKNTHEKQYDLILSAKEKLPSDAYIVSFNPSAIISTIHKKSIDIKGFIKNRETIEKEGNIIIFKDTWWYKEEELIALDKELKEDYIFQPIVEKGKYGFYNLTLK